VSTAPNRWQQQPCIPSTRADPETKLNTRLDLIVHRGPDARGIWINDDAPVCMSNICVPLFPTTHTPPALISMLGARQLIIKRLIKFAHVMAKKPRCSDVSPDLCLLYCP
jgi:hypothetical protein